MTRSVLWKMSPRQVILTEGLNRSWSTSLSLNIFIVFIFVKNFFICGSNLFSFLISVWILKTTFPWLFFLVNCIACKKLSGYKTWQMSCGHKDMKVYWYSTIFSCLCMIVSTVHLARCSSKTYSLKNVSMSAR